MWFSLSKRNCMLFISCQVASKILRSLLRPRQLRHGSPHFNGHRSIRSVGQSPGHPPPAMLRAKGWLQDGGSNEITKSIKVSWWFETMPILYPI